MGGSSSPNEPQPAPVVVREKVKSRPAVVVLSVLLILALISVGILGYLYVLYAGRTTQLVEDKVALSQKNAVLKANPTAMDGRGFIRQDSINTEVTNYLQANGKNDDNVLATIEYLDDASTFARVIVNKNLSKNEQDVMKGDVFHTFILKGVEGKADKTKSWTIAAVDADTAAEQKVIRDEFGVPSAVFT